MAGVRVAMKLVFLAKPTQDGLSAVDLVGGGVLIVITEQAEQRGTQIFGQVDRRNRTLGVELALIVDDHIAAPAIDDSINAVNSAGAKICMPPARAKTDDAELAAGIRLGPQECHSAGDVADDLVVRYATRCAHARTHIVGTPGTIAEIQMRGNRRKAVMGKLADHLNDPFIPAR